MVRRWACVAMLGLTACPGVEELPPCRHVPVAQILGLGIQPFLQQQPPLGLISAPMTVRVAAPITTCPGDDVRATVRLFDAANEEVPVEWTTTVTSPAETSFSFAEASATFTPPTAGRYGLEVAFEPSLGRRAVVIDVAEDGHAWPGIRVPVPVACDARVWPLADDRIACDERARSLVHLVSSDGGSERFPGEALVVVGGVLWTIDAGVGSLERRALTDAGLELTHVFPGYRADDYPGMHDEDVAIRLRASEGLAGVAQVGVIELLDGGARETLLDVAYEQPPVWFREELGQPSPFTCAGCREQPFFAIELRLLWDASGLEALDGLGGARGGVQGYARPYSKGGAQPPSVSLPYAPREKTLARAGFERVPLWLEPGLPGGRQAVAWHDGRQLRLTAWVPGAVLRIGRRHVVLRGPAPATVLVVPISNLP